MEFEKEFNIQISDEDAEKIQTVADVVNYIQSYINYAQKSCSYRNWSVNSYWAKRIFLLGWLMSFCKWSGPITRFDASKFKTNFACELKNFNAQDYIDRKELRKLDDFSVYALISTAEAIKNSNLDLNLLDLSRCGVMGLWYRRIKYNVL